MTASIGPKKNVASSEPVDAIPMKKSSPVMILAIIGAFAAVIGVVAFSMSGGKEKAPTPQQPQAAAVDTSGMTAEEQKRHLEITQKAVSNWKDQKAEDDAKKKAADEAAKEKETAAAAPVAGGGAPAPAGAAEPAPAPKKKPSKKELDQLEGLGAGISSELGK